MIAGVYVAHLHNLFIFFRRKQINIPVLKTVRFSFTINEAKTISPNPAPSHASIHNL